MILIVFELKTNLDTDIYIAMNWITEEYDSSEEYDSFLTKLKLKRTIGKWYSVKANSIQFKWFISEFSLTVLLTKSNKHTLTNEIMSRIVTNLAGDLKWAKAYIPLSWGHLHSALNSTIC